MSAVRWFPWRRARGRKISSAGSVECGLFGKLPKRRDFVRVGLAWPGLERWLEAQLERLAAKGESFGGDVLHLFVPGARAREGGDREGSDVWVVLCPSHDAAGRVFPVAFFMRQAAIPQEGLRAAWQRQARFFVEAESLLVRAQDGSVDSVSEGLPVAVAALGAALEAPCATGPAPVPRAFPGFSVAAQALFSAACAAGRTTPPLTVEVPAPDEVSRAFWLGRLDGDGPAEVATTARPTVLAGPRRMVLGFGAVEGIASVLAAHGLGARGGARHWLVPPESDALARDMHQEHDQDQGRHELVEWPSQEQAEER